MPVKLDQVPAPAPRPARPRAWLWLGVLPLLLLLLGMGGACLGFKEVGRYQAEIEPLGPYRGKSNGRYVPIEPENKAYIDQHGIPYGTW